MPRAASPAPRRAPRRCTAAAAATLLAVLVAGCGSSSSGGTAANPAADVPASSILYLGAVVRPEGGLKTATEAAGRSLTQKSDPYSRLLLALQTPGSPTLSFSGDVAPWLGPNAGVYLSSLASAGPAISLLEQGLLGSSQASSSYPFSASGAQGAIVMDTTDSSKALSFLNTQAQHAGAHAASYRGVSYQVTGDGLAFGLVDHLAVIGSESGLHGVVDTTLGGPALLRAAGYSKLLSSAPSGVLAHLYVGPTAQAAGTEASGLIGVLSGGREANISLVPSTTALSIDADSLTGGSSGTSGGGLLAYDPEGARALSDLPGESWLAVGLGSVGGSDAAGLRAVTSLLGSLGGQGTEAPGTLGIKPLLEGLLLPLQVLGADTPQAKRDFASWTGSAGVFAAGSSLLELKAGITIDSKDPSLSKAAVPELAAALHARGAQLTPVSVPGAEAAEGARVSGLPLELVIAAGRDSSGQAKLVIGLGEPSAQEALNPSSTLGSAPSHRAAEAALGESIQPNVMLDFPTLLSLLEGIGLTQDPTLAPVLPYLHAATTLDGGGHELSGEMDRYRLVLGLSQSGG